MPLILAIVADPHEAAQLAQLIQGRLSVDLVQAAEVGEGLLALDDRIPDLILTSPLMSPFDDGVLDEYLRDLGPAGAHVQTLRIPVLSQAPKKKPRLGFSLRRRSKPEAITHEGCEPKVFADEIEQYLSRAAEERRHAVASEASPVVAHEAAKDPSVEEEWTPAYSADSTPVYSPDRTPIYSPEPPAEQAAWSLPESQAEQAVWSAPGPEAEQAGSPAPEPQVEQAAWSAPEPEAEQAGSPAPEPQVEQAAWSAPEPEAEQSAWSAPEPQTDYAAWRTDLLDRPPVEDVPTYTTDHDKIAPTWAEETVDASAAAAEAEVANVPAVPSYVAEAPAVVTEPIEPEPQPAVVAAPIPAASVRAFEEPTIQESLEAAPLPEQAAVVQEDLAPVPTPTVTTQEGIGSDISRTIPDDPNAIKATPSFKAALAAIRAAWGKPPRKASHADVIARDEHRAWSDAPATHEAAAVDQEPEPVATLADTPAPVEVDLTGAVEMLDEQRAEESWVPAPPEPPAPAPRANAPEGEEVYELSVEPDLRELESRLFTPMPPAPKRTAATPRPAATPAVEPAPSKDERRTESSSDRRTKKKRGSKGAKAKAAPQPQAQPQPQPPAVQDEWGMFDPNRCGFAALVDKLDEVADEKAEQPQNGNKVRVISYS
jgi:hypothetical protein